jgi:hypothetical protein
MSAEDHQPWSDDEVRGNFDRTVRRFVRRFWIKTPHDAETLRFLRERNPDRTISEEPQYPGGMTRCVEVILDNEPHVIFARITVVAKAKLPEIPNG